MRQKNVMVLMILATILTAAEPAALAQDEAPDKKFGRQECSSEGIWYGGADLDDEGLFFKWILNVTPQRGSGYQITGYAGWGAGAPIATPMNGTSERIAKDTYEFFAIGYQNSDPVYPPLTAPTIIAVHGYMTQIDCNTTRAVYDFQGIYAWGAEPFVDPPLVDLGAWTEDYKRMATPEWPPAWQTP